MVSQSTHIVLTEYKTKEYFARPYWRLDGWSYPLSPFLTLINYL